MGASLVDVETAGAIMTGAEQEGRGEETERAVSSVCGGAGLGRQCKNLSCCLSAGKPGWALKGNRVY